MGSQSSQQGAEELEPQQYVDQHQPDKPNGESIQANGWSDLFDWELYGKDTGRDYVGGNTNFPVGDSNQGFKMYIPNINNVPRQSKAQVQDQTPWRNPNMNQVQSAHHNIPPPPQDNGSAAVMTSRVSSPPIGFAVDNSPAQDNNSLHLRGAMSSPAASHKLFPTAGLTNPAESSPGSRTNTPLKAGRQKESVKLTEASSNSPSKKPLLKKSSSKKTPSRKRKATSSPHNQAQSPVQPNENNGNSDTTGNLSVQANRSATAGFSLSPHGLPDPFSDVPEEPLPPSVNNSPVPMPPPSPDSRRERLKSTLSEYHINRMTAWKALPGSQYIKFFKELVRADDRGEELKDWELEFLKHSTEEDRTIVYREIALEVEEKVQALEERHNRLRQKLEDSKKSEDRLRQWNFALKRAVEKNELGRKEMETRIVNMERSHLELNQGLDERVHLLNAKVDRKVKELEEAIQKLKMGKYALAVVKGG